MDPMIEAYEVNAVPTILMFDYDRFTAPQSMGKFVGKHVGSMELEALQTFLDIRVPTLGGEDKEA